MRRLQYFIAPGIRISIVGLVLYALGAAAGASTILLPTHDVARDRAVAPVIATAPVEIGTVVLSPKDTFLKTDKKNYSTSATLNTYTWPDNKIANAILMKFDLSPIPPGSIVTSATLQLALVASDASPDPSYAVSAHKIVGKNPNITKATGYNADSAVSWTANNCCQGAPMAQSDLSPAYDITLIDKAPGFKSWTITAMVQEWLANPGSNLGLLLDSDASKPRDRYRTFASMEYSNASLRPSLKVTFAAADVLSPVVAITAPLAGDVSGMVPLTATATDNVAVASVQFKINGINVGPELTSYPYVFNWDTTSRSDGVYSLTAVATDTTGNAATSAPAVVTVTNGLMVLSPLDTSLSINTTNYSADPLLMTYTWPDFKPANAILMKFDLSTLPPGAVIQDAQLVMALLQSDAAVTESYNVSAHKVVGKNPVIAQANGYFADSATAWSPSTCCHDSVPLAQSDISPAYATRAVDATPGFKSWTITALAQEWLADPSTNFGVILNADGSKTRDRYRYFASMDNPDVGIRPMLRLTYSMNGDTTPPNLAAVTVSGVTAGSATITWTTDEPADSQVEYGPTSSYGNASPLDSAAVTGHSVTLSGLTDSTGYHFRVRSRDQSGNASTSGDFVFTTPDGTAPSVAVTAPANGATVSGTINLTAAASDNAGVTGVQFALDGASLGAEDNSAPYSTSWNTTATTAGNHTLTATARDAAGNVATSTAITVTVVNAPGSGLAALYPGDIGIENDPNVVFVERFDEASLANLFGRWTDILNGASMSISTDAPAGSPVGKSLTIPWSSGSSGGHLYRRLPQAVDDTLYVRYYVKYPAGSAYDHTGIWMGGYNPPLDWPNPQAGSKPAGNDRFSAAAEQNELNRFDHYDYWMGMRQSGDGSYWGNYLLNDPNVQATAGQWMCVEQMVKLNTPVTASNGEHAIWINGTKVSHVGPGFPNGSWSGGIFTQDPGGSPFQGLQWRNSSSLNLNWIWLQVFAQSGSGNLKYAHVVAARSYVGCLAAGSGTPDTTPPAISLSTPAAGASVSGSIAVAADASDAVGVAGVQFKLDGVNLGGEDTTAPYSVSWDTTTTINGPHTLTAVARDAAGNATISGSRSVTVNNASGGSAVFTSNWDTATGTSNAAVTDGGRWPVYMEFNGGSSVQLMSVVPDGVNGHNALRVQQRGSTFAANLQIDNMVPQSSDYYVRYYMKTDDTSSAGDHIVTVDLYNYSNLTFMRKYGGATNWNHVLSVYGCGYTYPIGHWGPAAPLQNGQWYRFEYYVHFVDATHVQVHPRVYDANGVLLLSDTGYRQSDFGSSSWNGRSDWTLASYYAAGHSFCVNPGWMNDFGVGNNGQQGASDTGKYWYFAGIEVRTDRWPGPVQ